MSQPAEQGDRETHRVREPTTAELNISGKKDPKSYKLTVKYALRKFGHVELRSLGNASEGVVALAEQDGDEQAGTRFSELHQVLEQDELGGALSVQVIGEHVRKPRGSDLPDGVEHGGTHLPDARPDRGRQWRHTVRSNDIEVNVGDAVVVYEARGDEFRQALANGVLPDSWRADEVIDDGLHGPDSVGHRAYRSGCGFRAIPLHG